MIREECNKEGGWVADLAHPFFQSCTFQSVIVDAQIRIV